MSRVDTAVGFVSLALLSACGSTPLGTTAPEVPPPATWEIQEAVGTISFTWNAEASAVLQRTKELPDVANERAQERASGLKRAEYCHQYDSDLLYPQLNDTNPSSCTGPARRYQASDRTLIVCWAEDEHEWSLELDMVVPVEQCPMVCAERPSAITAVGALCG